MLYVDNYNLSSLNIFNYCLHGYSRFKKTQLKWQGFISLFTAQEIIYNSENVSFTGSIEMEASLTNANSDCFGHSSQALKFSNSSDLKKKKKDKKEDD